MLVGATLPQFSDDRERLLVAARAAEEEGLDSLWLFDHLWPLSGGRARPILECWTTLAWLAAETSRIRLGTFVARSTLQRPALLAKMAATVGAIAPGRFIFAVGSGDEASRRENEAFGLEYHEADERVGQLEATVRIVKAYLSSDEVSVDTPFARVEGLRPSPTPAPPPDLWLGGRSDDVLAIAGRYAAGWNAWQGSPARFAAAAQQLLSYSGGRALELSWGGIVVLAGSDSAAAELLGDKPATGRIVGGPETVATALSRYIEAGARHLIVTPFGSTATPEFYRLLAEVRGLLGHNTPGGYTDGHEH